MKLIQERNHIEYVLHELFRDNKESMYSNEVQAAVKELRAELSNGDDLTQLSQKYEKVRQLVAEEDQKRHAEEQAKAEKSSNSAEENTEEKVEQAEVEDASFEEVKEDK